MIFEEKMALISNGFTKRAQIQLGSRYHVGINDRKSNDGTPVSQAQQMNLLSMLIDKEDTNSENCFLYTRFIVQLTFIVLVTTSIDNCFLFLYYFN